MGYLPNGAAIHLGNIKREDIQIDCAKPAMAMLAIQMMDPGPAQDVEIAKWMMHTIEDMRWRPLPSRPDEVKGYYLEPEKERRKMNRMPGFYAKFWEDPEVKKHFDQCESIKNFNYRNKNSLQWCLDILKDHELHCFKIREYLYAFKDPGSTPDPIEQPKWEE